MAIFRNTADLIKMLQEADPEGNSYPVFDGNKIVTDVRIVSGNTVELLSRSSLAGTPATLYTS